MVQHLWLCIAFTLVKDVNYCLLEYGVLANLLFNLIPSPLNLPIQVWNFHLFHR